MGISGFKCCFQGGPCELSLHLLRRPSVQHFTKITSESSRSLFGAACSFSNPNCNELICFSLEPLPELNPELPSVQQFGGDASDVRERSSNRPKSMSNIQKTLAALAGGVVLLFASAAHSGSRCPDRQMPESGSFQGRICQYGDWQVPNLRP